MPKYTCTKCGHTGYSKNIASRNFFPEDQMAAMLSNVFSVKTARTEDGCGWKVEFTATVWDAEIEPDDAEMDVANWISDAGEETRKHWLCNHTWDVDGEVEC